MRYSVLSPQSGFIRKATVCLHTFIPICADSATGGMVIIMQQIKCPNCGEVFNNLIEESKPKQEGICDKCHGNLTSRDDDSEETFEKRYQIYQKETEPLIKYYEGKNMAYHVDSSKDSDYAFKGIEQIIGGLYDKH